MKPFSTPNKYILMDLFIITINSVKSVKRLCRRQRYFKCLPYQLLMVCIGLSWLQRETGFVSGEEKLLSEMATASKEGSRGVNISPNASTARYSNEK
jgi:hypothetical protein